MTLTTSATQRLRAAVSKRIKEDFGAASQEMIDQMQQRLTDQEDQKVLTQALQIGGAGGNEPVIEKIYDMYEFIGVYLSERDGDDDEEEELEDVTPVSLKPKTADENMEYRISSYSRAITRTKPRG
jgi:hypothetical protein